MGEAANGEQAVHGAQRLKPDVVLMDIRMPELDGIAATRQIARGERTAARVLILTTFDLDEYVYDALGAGASGFLLKDSSPEQLVTAIRVVAGGEALLAPSVTSRLIEQFARARDRADRRRRRASTSSPRASSRSSSCSRAGCPTPRSPTSLVVGDSTVKTHVARLLGKLGLRDRVQAVVLAYESGLVSPGHQYVERTAGAPARNRFLAREFLRLQTVLGAGPDAPPEEEHRCTVLRPSSPPSPRGPRDGACSPRSTCTAASAGRLEDPELDPRVRARR